MRRMKGDEMGGDSASKAASIFKNPFDVEKDQLIRQVFELPVRMAAVVQSRRNQLSIGRADKIGSPFSNYAAKMAVREDMEARRPVLDKIDLLCQNKIDCATEAGQDAIKEPVAYGRRKWERVEFSQAAPPSLEYTSTGSADGCLCMDVASHNKLGELDVESQKSCKPLSMNANDAVFSAKLDEKLVEKCRLATQKQAGTSVNSQPVKKTRLVTGQNEVVPDLPVSTIKMKPHDIAEFIIMVITTLRHTRDSNMQKLFEILSIPDFPVDKCSFLEELIQQAHCYNKEGVAKELNKYRSEMLMTRMSDSSEEGMI